MIWRFEEVPHQLYQQLAKDTMMENLDIKILALTDNTIKATMPVGPKVLRIGGILHGGASVALAETVAGIGAACIVDIDQYDIFGVEINANHLLQVKSGTITSEATPIKLGKRTQVWDIRNYNNKGDLICICRHTIIILEKKQ